METEKQNRLFLAKILGEVYRLQKHNKTACEKSDATIFGLLNGFEHVVEEELDSVGFVSQDAVSVVVKVLNRIDEDPDRLKAFKGFYDIEHELKEHGVDRYTASRVLTYLNANHQFQELIGKMDTHGSPSECRTFSISKWDS